MYGDKAERPACLILNPNNSGSRIKENPMKEIWKDVFGYEGFYQISSLGNVKSLDRIVKNKASKRRGEYFVPIKGKYPKQHKNVKGYLTVGLCKDKKHKSVLVHRLVALHFIPNPGMLDQVNHIDGDKTNDCVENLEWCTQVENAMHAVRTGLLKPHNEHRVVGTDSNGNKVYFKSAAEAGRVLSIDSGSICSVCTGYNPYRHTAGGYKWEYVD